MATYRQVHIKYWQDPFVEELEPLQRYFYLYLMTNSKTTQCGCYEISSKLIKYETGLNQNQVDNFIELLEKNNKIKFSKETNEFLLINWLKHNSFTSPKVKACINKEINNIKNQVFIDFINSVINNETTIDSLLIVYPNTIHTDTQKEKEKEKEEKKENKDNKNTLVCDDEFEDFWLLYDKKVSKPICIKKWNKISKEDKELIFKNLPAYIKSTPDKKYRKNPETWLNQECWNDELIEKSDKTTETGGYNNVIDLVMNSSKTKREDNVIDMIMRSSGG